MKDSFLDEVSRSYDLLKKDMQDEVSGQCRRSDRDGPVFAALFHSILLNMCKVIRLDNVIACFEEPVYGTVAKPSEYTLYLFMTGISSAIPLYLDAKQSEAGHQAKQKISQTHPWIYAVSQRYIS